MKRALNYLWRGWMVLLAGILLILFFIPVYLLSIKKEHYKYAYFFVRLWCKGVFYGMDSDMNSLIRPTKKLTETNNTLLLPIILRL